jgi:arylsulfatase A-like enzyme
VPVAQRPAVLRAARERYAQHPQVFAAYTRDEVMAVPMPTGMPDKWSILQRVRASYGPRSGDLYVVLKEYISPIPVATAGFAATHASPWDYDRRVPIVFWRKGQRGAALNQLVETVDIMPTLAAIIGLRVQRSTIDGKCLRAAGASCSQ